MASPEIKLPPTSSDFVEKDSNSDIQRAEKASSAEETIKSEKSEHTPSSTEASQSRLDHADQDAPIIYHYLTFETDLPSPTTLISSDPNAPPAPEAPDLKNHISPFLWSASRKTLITWLSCISTVVTAYTAGSYSSAAAQLSAEWSVSETAVLVGITTFSTGFAIAPMVLAPFSEINGRYPVFVATGVLFVICQLGCALTTSFPGMLIARFFAGVGGSTFSTMVGGVVSDIYHAEDRNTPMAIFAGGALVRISFADEICALIFKTSLAPVWGLWFRGSLPRI